MNDRNNDGDEYCSNDGDDDGNDDGDDDGYGTAMVHVSIWLPVAHRQLMVSHLHPLRRSPFIKIAIKKWYQTMREHAL